MSHPVQSPPESLMRVQSLPGLVEEDVSRLRVLGDVWGKPVKLLDGLGVNFLHKTSETVCKQLFTDAAAAARTDDSGNTEHINKPRLRVTHLHNVIIEQQPEAVTLHYGDVMTSVWAAEETHTHTDSL